MKKVAYLRDQAELTKLAQKHNRKLVRLFEAFWKEINHIAVDAYSTGYNQAIKDVTSTFKDLAIYQDSGCRDSKSRSH